MQLWPSLDSPEMKTRAAASHANNMPSVPYPCQIMLHLAFPVSAQIICHAGVSAYDRFLIRLFASRLHLGALKSAPTRVGFSNRSWVHNELVVGEGEAYRGSRGRG